MLITAADTVSGGGLKNHTQMIDDARRTAAGTMIYEAQSIKADAIVGVRCAASSAEQSAAEVMAYGTAVIARL